MKVIFFANGNFSFNSILSIFKSKNNLLNVISDEPQKKGRGLKKQYSNLVQNLINNKIPHLLKTDINNHNFITKLKKFDADVFIVISYKLIPKIIYSIPKHGTINLHGSLLPLYRGAAPIQRSIMNGDKFLGVSTFFINESIDCGNVISQSKLEIDKHITFSLASKKLSKLGSTLLIKTLKLIKNKNFVSLKQKIINQPYAYKIKKEEYRISFNDKAINIHNKIRGLTLPGCYALLNDKRVKLFNTYYINKKNKLTIGEYRLNNKKLEIGCSSGLLTVNNIQIEGKTIISATDFYNNQSILIKLFQ